MKKFFVGLLSIFLMFGGLVLSACTGSKVTIELSENYKEIVVLDKNDITPVSVFAYVKGVENGKVLVTSSSNEIVSAKVTYNNIENKNIIELTPGAEGTASVVVYSADDHKAKTTISVYVHGEVTKLEANTKKDEEGKSVLYAVRGRSRQLTSELLSFTTSIETTRTDVEWSFPEGVNYTNAEIVNNNLILGDNFSASEIALVATSKYNKDVLTDVLLSVLEPIDVSSVSLEYTLDKSQTYLPLANTDISIVPNIPEESNAYIRLSFSEGEGYENYLVKPIVKKTGGNQGNISILSDVSTANVKQFYVKADFNSNTQVRAEFEISYRDFSYSERGESFTISAYEKINKVEISNDKNVVISSSSLQQGLPVQNIYTAYASAYGSQYKVSLLPNTVIKDESYRYRIEVDYSATPLAERNENSLKFFFLDAGGSLVQVPMIKHDELIYTNNPDYPISAKTLYLISSVETPIENVGVRFISLDNENAVAHCKMSLYKATNSLNFDKEQGKVSISTNDLTYSVRKEFTLQGQSSVDGLYISSDCSLVEFSALTVIPTEETDRVKFYVDISLKSEALGRSENSTYQIKHLNGVESVKFDIELFLPLSDASVNYNSASSNSSVITFERDNKIFAANNSGVIESTSNLSGLRTLRMKTGGSIGLEIITNKVAENQAKAEISYSYLDFLTLEDEGSELYNNALSTFMAKSAQEILADAELSNLSRFLSIKDKTLSATNRGYTWVVAQFNGLNQEGQPATYYRVFMVENFVMPSELSVSGDASAITLYASDSVSEEFSSSTRKTVRLNFGVAPITYKDFKYFSFQSGSFGDADTKSLNLISWQEENFSLSNIVITGTYMTFVVNAQTTGGQQNFYDDLIITYIFEDSNHNYFSKKVVISLNILNADRTESVKWENETDDIYFELREAQQSVVLVLYPTPTNAKSNELRFVVTDEGGNTSDFVKITKNQSNAIVNLKPQITEGKNGYIYIIPEDAINGGIINFYFDETVITGAGATVERRRASIMASDIGKVRSDGNGTNYDYLKTHAYFINNSNEKILFSDFLIKVKVIVADGKSFDTAYRVFSSSDFSGIKANEFYTIVNDMIVDSSVSFEDFTGGIQGLNESVTLSLNKTLININHGQIRNITFSGSVSGSGFVANENYGTIENVTVDVKQIENGYTFSSLNTEATSAVGGIVGTNYGTIFKAGVLGLNISASQASFVGGIAGDNRGTIKNSRFEFYNFKGAGDAPVTNKISGLDAVGGIVGIAKLNSKVLLSFAYDYTLKTGSEAVKNITGANAGALIGTYESGATVDESIATVEQSFAVVNLGQAVGSPIAAGDSVIKNSYISYYNKLEDNSYSYTSTYFSNVGTSSETVPTDSELWISNGETGFKSYVNSGKAYLKDNFQDEALSSVEGFKISQFVDNRDYYRSLPVEGSGLLFYYNLSAKDMDSLTEKELSDLNSLNTISLKNLFNIDENKASKLVISSSNNKVLQVSGNNLIVKGVGDAVISLYSKQDYSINKSLNIKVVHALSPLKASYSFNGGSIEISQNSENLPILSLQKGKSLPVIFRLSQQKVYLGNLANSYQFETGQFELAGITNAHGSVNPIGVEKIDKMSVLLSASKESAETTLKMEFAIDSIKDTNFLKAINDSFAKRFIVRPVDGTINVAITGDVISMTPSTSGKVNAVMLSSSATDRLVPKISFKSTNAAGEEVLVDLKASNETTFGDTNNGFFSYEYSAGESKRFAVTASFTRTYNEAEGIYTYQYTFIFMVHESYRESIFEDQSYFVTLQAQTQLVSKSFELHLSKQEFTNLDVSAYKITSQYREGNYTVNETKAEVSSVIAPGTGAIIQVNVNPTFAYYDYMTVEYGGLSVAGAVSLSYMEKMENEDKKFKAYSENVSALSNGGLRVEPISKHKGTGNLYFKVWLSDKVNVNELLTFIFKFYDNEGGYSHVNYSMNVSYMSDPQISIDGSTAGLLAIGQQAEVEITIDADKSVDLDSIKLENAIRGITISRPIFIKEENGKKIYKSFLNATVLAQTSEDSDNTIRVSAKVNRVVNGEIESKETSASIRLVPFKINAENVYIEGNEGSSYDAYLAITKTLIFRYPLVPDEYIYDKSDTASHDAVQGLVGKRDGFTNSGIYNSEGNYKINAATNKEGVFEGKDVVSRLQYFDNDVNGWVNVYNETNGQFATANGYVRFSRAANSTTSINIEGLKETKENSPLRLKLSTYVYIAGQMLSYDKEFNINVTVYTDEDLPKTVSSADEFVKMNEGNPQHYILMKDIHLTNYLPIETENISSFDGNGHTIYLDSFDMASLKEGAINLSLFNNISSNTTIKNVRVNYISGGNLIVDVNKFNAVNVAGFAISNRGVVTNCEVVSFGEQAGIESSGINVKFIRGAGTTDEVFLTYGSNFTTQTSGFVISNSGSITNSRVGGDSVKLISDNSEGNGGNIFSVRTKELDNFVISAQGNVAGFVLENTGAIAASFVKNISIINKTASKDYYLAGFAGNNSGSILTSFIEGVQSDSKVPEYNKYCREGSSLSSSYGMVAGFNYDNKGQISDCYSNILISNASSGKESFYVSGFVYKNEGKINNAYSASQIQNLKYSQMNFSGVDENGQSLTTSGSYVNCYYYNKEYAANSDIIDDSTEAKFNTGAFQLKDVGVANNFYGFAIKDDSSEAIWVMTEKGIRLVEAENVAISNRYYVAIENSGVVDQASYKLPYATLKEDNMLFEVKYGSRYNPILIRSAKEFVEVTGTSKSSNVSEYLKNGIISGTYRLVKDIDLGELLTDPEEKNVYLPSANKAFTGIFYGNGFSIQNVTIAENKQQLAYGLFGSIEKNYSTNVIISPKVLNLNITVSGVQNNQASFVGGLAGLVKDGRITNVNVSYSTDAVTRGLNFVGGVVGLVLGDSELKNITVNDPNVVADKYNQTAINDALNSDSLMELRTYLKGALGGLTSDKPSSTIQGIINNIKDYSYAGGVVGYSDIFLKEESTSGFQENDYFKLNNNFSNMTSLKVTGTVKIKGQVSGGVAGLTGNKTISRDLSVIVNGNGNENTSKIISTKYYAGGVIGQSFGAISQIVSRHSENVQNNIESNVSNYYLKDATVEHGIIDLFNTDAGESYTQQAVGGLIGYVGSGAIQVGYSKLNVIAKDSIVSGGLIGLITLGKVSPYKVTSNLNNFITKLSLKELYATGDVRAKDYAGGIIGGITEKSSSILMQSINSLNYFTNINYNTGKPYTELDFGVSVVGNKTGSFNGLNIYSFIGKLPDDVNNDDYTETFIMTGIISIDTSEETEKPADLPSIGYLHGYAFRNYTLTADFFNGFSSEFPADKKGGLSKDAFFKIQKLSDYTSPAVGNTFTQAAFLKSGAWASDNWVHPSLQLYPEIRYSKFADAVIYLDVYNKEQIVKLMQGNTSGIEIRVRGRVSEDNETDTQDVDLRTISSSTNNVGIINGFGGTLSGYEGVKARKIIIDKPLFETLAPNSKIKNLSVEYKSKDSNSNLFQSQTQTKANSTTGVYAGAFINQQAVDLTVLNLKLDFSSVESSVLLSGNNVGIVAPSLQSPVINGIKIVLPSSKVEAFLAVSYRGSDDNAVFNAGVFAGEVKQSSEIKISQIQNIILSNPGNKFTLMQVQGIDNMNIGGYFGNIIKDEGSEEKKKFTQPLRVELNEFDISSAVKIIVSKNGDITTATTATTEKTTNIGGFVGKASAVDEFNMSAKEKNLNNINFNLGSAFTTLNLGGVVGLIEDSSLVNIRGNSSMPSTVNVYGSGQTSANIGGLVGKNTTPVEITSASINFSLTAGTNAPSNNPFVITTQGNIGSMVGYANASCKINAGNEGIEINTARDKIYVATAEETTQATAESDTTPPTSFSIGSIVGGSVGTLQITGKIISNAEISWKSVNNNVFLGGLVGSWSSSNSMQINGAGTRQNLAEFDGTILVNDTSNNVNVGGIIGSVTAGTLSNGSKPSVSLQRLGMGGQIKILKAKNIRVGGTVGSITNGNLTLAHNYIFGDVFVEEAIEDYIFGGIIGFASLNVKENSDVNSPPDTIELHDNYSLMTNNNPYMSSSNFNGSAALFGTGFTVADLSGKTPFVYGNYYHYGMSLLPDEIGNDMGYSYSYENMKNFNGGGYGKEKTEKTIKIGEYSLSGDLISVIRSAINHNSANFSDGHKLKPKVITTGTNIDGTSNIADASGDTDPSFHGITYYSLSKPSSNTTSLNSSYAVTAMNNNNPWTLNNVAIIGQGLGISTSKQLIGKMSGHSFISGLNVINNIKGDYDANDTISGLVKELEKGIIYATGITGSIDVGANAEGVDLFVAGLVGKQSNTSFISDCYSDMDITYRAGGDGQVSGLVNGDGLIRNSFTGGSLTCYIDVKMNAFNSTTTQQPLQPSAQNATNNAQPQEGSKNFKLVNCYTFTKMDWYDHTTAATAPDSNKGLKVFDGTSLSNCYYDKFALERATTDTNACTSTEMQAWGWDSISDSSSSKDSSTSETPDSSTESTSNNSDCKWIKNSETGDINYGYPTRPFGHLQPSSYFLQTSLKEDTSGRKIEEYSYTRLNREQTIFHLANQFNATEGIYKNTDSTIASTVFIGASNATVLSNMLQSKEMGVLLVYDIDLGKQGGWSSLSIPKDSGFTTLDGKGKTINNDDSNIFGSLILKKVINLRLTDFNITTGGLLAQIIEGCTINNITLEGNISGTGNIGGLAGEAKAGTVTVTTEQEVKEEDGTTKVDADGKPITTSVSSTNYVSSSISNVTNLVKVNSTSNAGGIIGKVSSVNENENSEVIADDNVIFNFCSNYAPIQADNASQTVNVGGIVGEAAANVVFNKCYNANSILANFSDSSSHDNYGGGLIGFASSLTVEGCYNSGFVKVGNKANSSSAFAAGLFASASSVNISNSFNSANVEALAINAGYEYSWDESKTKIQLVSTATERNVYANSIGFCNANRDINTSYTTATNVFDNAQEIFNNGALFTNRQVVVDDFGDQGSKSKIEELERSYFPGKNFITTNGKIREPVLDITMDNPSSISVLSYNNLGMPVVGALKLNEEIRIAVYETTIKQGNVIGWTPPQPPAYVSNPIYEYRAVKELKISAEKEKITDLVSYALIDLSKIVDKDEKLVDIKSLFKKHENNSNVTESDNGIQGIIENTRKNTNNGNDSIKIAGIDYLIAKDSSSITAFQAGSTILSFDYTSELDYQNNSNFYTITSTQENIKYEIKSISKNTENKAVFKIKASLIGQFPANQNEIPLNFSISCQYPDLNIDLSEIKWYKDGDTFGFFNDSIVINTNAYSNNGIRLVKNSKSYGNVMELISVKDYEDFNNLNLAIEMTNGQPISLEEWKLMRKDKDSGEFLNINKIKYFAYDSTTNTFEFIKNAELYTNCEIDVNGTSRAGTGDKVGPLVNSEGELSTFSGNNFVPVVYKQEGAMKVITFSEYKNDTVTTSESYAPVTTEVGAGNLNQVTNEEFEVIEESNSTYNNNIQITVENKLIDSLLGIENYRLMFNQDLNKVEIAKYILLPKENETSGWQLVNNSLSYTGLDGTTYNIAITVNELNLQFAIEGIDLDENNTKLLQSEIESWILSKLSVEYTLNVTNESGTSEETTEGRLEEFITFSSSNLINLVECEHNLIISQGINSAQINKIYLSNEEVVFALSQDGIWYNKNNTLTINGMTFNVSIVQNGVKLTLNNQSSDSYINILNSFLSQMKCVTSDDSKKETNVSNVIPEITTKYGWSTLTIEKIWHLSNASSNIELTTKDNGDAVVKLTGGWTTYSLGNISIDYIAPTTVSIFEKYFTKQLSIKIENVKDKYLSVNVGGEEKVKEIITVDDAQSNKWERLYQNITEDDAINKFNISYSLFETYRFNSVDLNQLNVSLKKNTFKSSDSNLLSDEMDTANVPVIINDDNTIKIDSYTYYVGNKDSGILITVKKEGELITYQYAGTYSKTEEPEVNVDNTEEKDYNEQYLETPVTILEYNETSKKYKVLNEELDTLPEKICYKTEENIQYYISDNSIFEYQKINFILEKEGQYIVNNGEYRIAANGVSKITIKTINEEQITLPQSIEKQYDLGFNYLSNITVSGLENLEYNISGNNLTINFRNKEKTSTKVVNFSIEPSSVDSNGQEKLVKSETAIMPIIIEKDIIFQEEWFETEKNEAISISGNGYFINLMNMEGAVYQKLSGDDTFIKDIKIMGECTSNAFFVTEASTSKVINTSIYGSLIKKANKQTGVLSNDVYGIKSYISMQSVDNYNQAGDIQLFASSEKDNLLSSFKNYGTIITGDGIDGSSGNTGATGGAGGNGGAPGKILICASYTGDNENNFGVVKLGLRGNGGAGGNSIPGITPASETDSKQSPYDRFKNNGYIKHEDEFTFDDDSKKFFAGAPGSGGKGNIFNSNTKECDFTKFIDSANGVDGGTGAKGRNGFGWFAMSKKVGFLVGFVTNGNGGIDYSMMDVDHKRYMIEFFKLPEGGKGESPGKCENLPLA